MIQERVLDLVDYGLATGLIEEAEPLLGLFHITFEILL